MSSHLDNKHDELLAKSDEIIAKLNLIENTLYQNADGTGNTAGINLDSIISKCNDWSNSPNLCASRLNNIQNKLMENTDGSGDTTGQLLKDIKDLLTTIEVNTR